MKHPRRRLALAAVLLAAGTWGTLKAATPTTPGLQVIAAAPPHRHDYQRSCSPGSGCVFGPAWTDDTTGTPWSHDGCDTRSQVLARDLTAVVFKPGTRQCAVASGTLTDPYTGSHINYTRTAGNQISIDHILPLAVAWDRGANAWSLELRQQFANDPDNLLATSASVNQAKSDKMPDRWQPTTPPGRCLYATKLIQVAIKYGLAVTITENASLHALLNDCELR